jgi:hypothetical protein
MTFIDNKHPVSVRHEVNEVEAINPFTVRPATRKISGAINPVIQRAGEVEVRGLPVSQSPHDPS